MNNLRQVAYLLNFASISVSATSLRLLIIQNCEILIHELFKVYIVVFHKLYKIVSVPPLADFSHVINQRVQILFPIHYKT